MERLGHHHLENNFIVSERMKCKVLGVEGRLPLHLGILLSPKTSVLWWGWHNPFRFSVQRHTALEFLDSI